MLSLYVTYCDVDVKEKKTDTIDIYYSAVCSEGMYASEDGSEISLNGDEDAEDFTYAVNPVITTNKYVDDTTVQCINEYGNVISESILDEQGRNIGYKIMNDDGELYLREEKEYDEYGNKIGTTTYRPDGTILSVTKYNNQLNTYNQVVLSEAVRDGEVGGSTLFEYGNFNREVTEEFLNNPLIGYWLGEQDGRKVFLVISVNGMLCKGFVDEETGLYLPEFYAYFEEEEEGILDCEWYANAREDGESSRLNDLSDDIAFEVNETELVFDGVTYEKID